MRKYNEHGDRAQPCALEAKFFQVFPIEDGWIALAKEEPFSGVNDPVNEVGDLWFAFGDTSHDALERLRRELHVEGISYTPTP